MPIQKSTGVTDTENYLAELCERSFLKLWSYPNPYKDDGKELCDLLATFDNHVFIFFDREKPLDDAAAGDPQLLWNRWKRKVIDAQVKTANGAERYIKSGRSIFLDAKKKTPFPIKIDVSKMIVHKFVVAHGAKEACERASDDNVFGSLAVAYGEPVGGSPYPFLVHIDKDKPVHIFDSHNLPIILEELDTVADFTAYLDAKLRAIAGLDSLVYCGEEDLLAHYLYNHDEKTGRNFIGTKDESFNLVAIGEGEWRDFTSLSVYKNTKKANQISYFWDNLIQKTCENSLEGRLLGHDIISHDRSAIHEMAKEPRFMRRALSEQIFKAVENFPGTAKDSNRSLSYMPSFYPNKGYVFLQLWSPEIMKNESDHRAVRQSMLEIACGAAKNKFKELHTVVGIAVDSPKFASLISEDFILMDCDDWTDEQEAHYEEANKVIGFFQSPTLIERKRTVTQFVPPNGGGED